MINKGQYLDAAQIVSRIPAFAKGVDQLIVNVLPLTEKFRESSSYPRIAGDLNASAALLDADENRKESALRHMQEAFAIYRTSTTTSVYAAFSAKWIIKKSFPDEDKVWHNYDACTEFARSNLVLASDCYEGLADGLLETAIAKTKFRLDQLRAADALRSGLIVLQEKADATWSPLVRYDYRSDLAWLAIAAGDMASFDKLNAEIVEYYTSVKPNPYQLASHFNRAATVATTIDPKLALALYKRFDDSHGSSDYWNSYADLDIARLAKSLGEEAVEEEFLTKGRGAAQRAGSFNIAYYDMFANADAVAQNDFARAATAYLNAAADLARYAPGSTLFREELEYDGAVALALSGDAARAREILQQWDGHAEQGHPRSGDYDIPCFSSLVLRTEAAVQRMLGECALAEHAQAAAGTLVTRCTANVPLDNGDGQWTDGPGFLREFKNACHGPIAEDNKSAFLDFLEK
jgi:hypothetical protein